MKLGEETRWPLYQLHYAGTVHQRTTALFRFSSAVDKWRLYRNSILTRLQNSCWRRE